MLTLLDTKLTKRVQMELIIVVANKQNSVALSTTEVEYFTIDSCCTLPI